MSGKHSISAKIVPVLSAALALLVAGAWQGLAFGQTVAIWDGGTGVWSDAANWNCDCVPNGFGYDANIGNTAYGNVTLNLSVELAGLSLGNGAFGELQVVNGNSLTASNAVLVGASSAGELSITNRGVVNDADGELGALAGSAGTATVSGNGSQWNNSGNLFVGYYGQGSLTVNAGGTLTSNDGYIGESSGGSGNVLLTGEGSRWNDSGQFFNVGYSGQGTLTIQNGGVVNSNVSFVGAFSTGSGTVTVTGAGSQWNAASPEGPLSSAIEVGSEGRGTLTVENGGSVRSNSGICIGCFRGSTGIVSVTGTGSQLNLASLSVGGGGLGGSGTLIIENGGAVNGGQSGISTESGVASATVAGVGSQLNTSVLVLGEAGNGTLTLERGAQGSGALGIGDELGYSGLVTLTDPGTIWTNRVGQVNVGSFGTGTLVIENGAVLNTRLGTMGVFAGSLGTATVTGSGSAWNNTVSLNVGTGGTGILTVNNGGLVAAGTVQNPGTITIGTHGTVDAKGGTLIGNVFNDGTFDPLGTATVDGGFTLNPDGTLSLDVAGTGVDQYGVLAVSDFGTFDGTLTLDFINGFAPLQGDMFDFINDPGGASFNWAGIDILGLQPGFEYDTNFTDGQFTLTALNNGVSSSPEPGTLLLLSTALVAFLLR